MSALHPAKGDILRPGKRWLPTDVVPQQAEDSLTVGPRPREGVTKMLVTISVVLTYYWRFPAHFLPGASISLWRERRHVSEPA